MADEEKKQGDGEEDLKKKDKCPLSYRTKLFLGSSIVALLIAPAMLVAPPLLVAPLILVIPIFFAVACVLEDKLKNSEKAIRQINDRFGDVLIGIISGVVASYLMWVLLTFGGISLSLLFLAFPMLVASLVVAFTLIVVWVSFTTK